MVTYYCTNREVKINKKKKFERTISVFYISILMN